jgi:hypothetical protein
MRDPGGEQVPEMPELLAPDILDRAAMRPMHV